MSNKVIGHLKFFRKE